VRRFPTVGDGLNRLARGALLGVPVEDRLHRVLDTEDEVAAIYTTNCSFFSNSNERGAAPTRCSSRSATSSGTNEAERQRADTCVEIDDLGRNVYMADEQTPVSLLMAFDTDDPEFARGFEVGRLWQQLQAAPTLEPFEGELVHANNAEMLMRLGEATGRSATAVEIDSYWLKVSFGPAESVEAVQQ
jgi:hypothetical protein